MMTQSWDRSDGFDEWQGCLGCANYRSGRCDAFPNGIPLPIISSEIDHLRPRPGQVSEMVFEPLNVEHWRSTGERRPAPVTIQSRHHP
jgi:hypothetical protein